MNGFHIFFDPLENDLVCVQNLQGKKSKKACQSLWVVPTGVRTARPHTVPLNFQPLAAGQGSCQGAPAQRASSLGRETATKMKNAGPCGHQLELHFCTGLVPNPILPDILKVDKRDKCSKH